MRHFWIITIITGILALQACKNNEQQLSIDLINNPTSYNKNAKNETLPKIKFDKTEYDFGQLIEGEVVKYAFKFTNVGKADLIISNVHASCGCTVAEYPQKAIAPGSSANIKVKFNSKGRTGFQNKSITVGTNGIPAKHILRIKANVANPTS